MSLVQDFDDSNNTNSDDGNSDMYRTGDKIVWKGNGVLHDCEVPIGTEGMSLGPSDDDSLEYVDFYHFGIVSIDRRTGKMSLVQDFDDSNNTNSDDGNSDMYRTGEDEAAITLTDLVPSETLDDFPPHDDDEPVVVAAPTSPIRDLGDLLAEERAEKLEERARSMDLAPSEAPDDTAKATVALDEGETIERGSGYSEEVECQENEIDEPQHQGRGGPGRRRTICILPTQMYDIIEKDTHEMRANVAELVNEAQLQVMRQAEELIFPIPPNDQRKYWAMATVMCNYPERGVITIGTTCKNESDRHTIQQTIQDGMVTWWNLRRGEFKFETPKQEQHSIREDQEMQDANRRAAPPLDPSEKEKKLVGDGGIALLTQMTNTHLPSMQGAEHTEYTVLGRLLDICNHFQAEAEQPVRYPRKERKNSLADHGHFDDRIVLEYTPTGLYVVWDTTKDNPTTIAAKDMPSTLISRFWGGQGEEYLERMSQNNDDKHGKVHARAAWVKYNKGKMTEYSHPMLHQRVVIQHEEMNALRALAHWREDFTEVHLPPAGRVLAHQRKTPTYEMATPTAAKSWNIPTALVDLYLGELMCESIEARCGTTEPKVEIEEGTSRHDARMIKHQQLLRGIRKTAGMAPRGTRWGPNVGERWPGARETDEEAHRRARALKVELNGQNTTEEETAGNGEQGSMDRTEPTAEEERQRERSRVSKEMAKERRDRLTEERKQQVGGGGGGKPALGHLTVLRIELNRKAAMKKKHQTEAKKSRRSLEGGYRQAGRTEEWRNRGRDHTAEETRTWAAQSGRSHQAPREGDNQDSGMDECLQTLGSLQRGGQGKELELRAGDNGVHTPNVRTASDTGWGEDIDAITAELDKLSLATGSIAGEAIRGTTYGTPNNGTGAEVATTPPPAHDTPTATTPQHDQKRPDTRPSPTTHSTSLRPIRPPGHSPTAKIPRKSDDQGRLAERTSDASGGGRRSGGSWQGEEGNGRPDPTVDGSGGDGARPQEEGASRRCTEAGEATTAQKGQEPGEPTSSEAGDGGAGDSKGGGSLPSPPRETAKQRTATEEAVAEEINIAEKGLRRLDSQRDERQDQWPRTGLTAGGQQIESHRQWPQWA